MATTNTAMQFEAAAADVKAILDINQEGLNRTWDRTDALLDYIFKGSVAQEEFELKLLLGQMQAQAGASGGKFCYRSRKNWNYKMVVFRCKAQRRHSVLRRA